MLKGKIIAITGASSGIGRELARMAAAEGAVPILLARTIQALEELKAELIATAPECAAYPLDVTDNEQVEDTVKQIFDTFGRIDVWVNNAGYGIFSEFTLARLEDFTDMMDVNYMGTVRCAKAVLPHMLIHNSGHIINIASVAGKIATPKSSGYSATKFAVIAFTSTLRQELAGTGVKVTAINPGPVETAFFNRADATGEYRKNIERFMLTPQQVAGAILQSVKRYRPEIILPGYMKLGVIIQQLMPGLFDRVISPRINKK
ncbi:SDR family oxidoreductase [Aneurinibacillus sp. Ricciae_BoGa-3]|uniref:SDR family oxidoreductase n=1 Tax=Aneurinibacillus sp. Ricciae_BoGa-3 TaxID=3022697 RepID=UPI00234119EB|nr:SDR family oxidoreductase [Aneurinibacillus sp. Ricciae_BoGa-3]WCK55803.1 SDR family oxidoreductase [Aneurinibacillus sp. Ricciae_BoGa-3]